MLTPPSRHLRVMQQNVAESKAVAEALREQNFSEKVAADRANVVGQRRQQISKAHREREAFLVHVRGLFEMNSPVKLPGPLQRVPLKAKVAPSQVSHSKAVEKIHPLWSEVSTAAPSTVGADDEISLKPEDDAVPSQVKQVLSRPWQDEMEKNSLKELELALTKVHRDEHKASSPKCSNKAMAVRVERDVLDETLSSSDESFLEIDKANAPKGRANVAISSAQKNSEVRSSEASKVQSAAQCSKCSRSVESSLGTGSVQQKCAQQLGVRVGKKSRPASGALRSISKEEEALQKSLLRMDFEEMKRQFSGQKALWRDNEEMGESFKTDPQRESKLEASLLRLDEKFHHLQAQHEVRLKQDQEKGEGQPRPSSVKRNARVRPRSSVGRTYSTQRRWRVRAEVPTIHAGPRVSKQGEGS